jgi:hypothetical protein
MRSEWNLDDPSQFAIALALELPIATTWADTRFGKTDYRKRQRLRSLAVGLLRKPSNAKWWAVRVSVKRRRRGRFDIENAAKIIVDAFCGRQIAADARRYPEDMSFVEAELYPDDSVDHVRVLRVVGERGDSDATTVEIFGYVGEPSEAIAVRRVSIPAASD